MIFADPTGACKARTMSLVANTSAVLVKLLRQRLVVVVDVVYNAIDTKAIGGAFRFVVFARHNGSINVLIKKARGK